MPQYEYKVVPAPERGMKAKGAKSTAERFAVALESLMNEMGAEGWEYQRTDTLPCQERVGLTGKQTSFQHMLVFRRTVGTASDNETNARPATPAAESPEAEARFMRHAPKTQRDTEAAARTAAGAEFSAYQSEGRAPALGPANGSKSPGKPKLATK